MIRSIREKGQAWKAWKQEIKAKNSNHYLLIDIVETIAVALAIALLFRKYIVMTSLVPSSSMVPTLNVGDRLFVNKFIYRFMRPKTGDIVVFKSIEDDKDYVKRAIALPGETVSIDKGFVYINKKQLVVPGVNIRRDYQAFAAVTVPDSHYFVLGDNRAHSYDSRYWKKDQFVPESHLLGKAMFTFFPFNRMQPLR